jgi:hypothetical protein
LSCGSPRDVSPPQVQIALALQKQLESAPAPRRRSTRHRQPSPEPAPPAEEEKKQPEHKPDRTGFELIDDSGRPTLVDRRPGYVQALDARATTNIADFLEALVNSENPPAYAEHFCWPVSQETFSDYTSRVLPAFPCIVIHPRSQVAFPMDLQFICSRLRGGRTRALAPCCLLFHA